MLFLVQKIQKYFCFCFYFSRKYQKSKNIFLCANFSFSFVLSWKVISGVDETRGDCIEDLLSQGFIREHRRIRIRRSKKWRLFFRHSICQPQKHGEAVLEDYVTDCIEASSINLLLSMNLLKWSRRLFLSVVLSEDSQAESAIFQESFHQASSPNVRSESNLEEKPNRSRWSHSWRFIKFILKLWRNQRLMLKPSSQWRLTRKSQLLFRGSLLGQLEKKAINQGGDCWVKNMVYTLLF